MSDFLYLTLEGVEDLCLDEIVASVQQRCEGLVLSNMLQGLRLVRRNTRFGITLEPFLASAALSALLHSPRKRPAVHAIIGELVAECHKRASIVGIARIQVHHTGPEIWPATEESGDIERALDPKLKGSHWFKLRSPMRLFRVPRAEVRLWQSLPIAGNPDATHYYREYWVRAWSASEAKKLVHADAAADGEAVVDLSEVEELDEPALLDSDASEPAIVRMSERIFSRHEPFIEA